MEIGFHRKEDLKEKEIFKENDFYNERGLEGKVYTFAKEFVKV